MLIFGIVFGMFLAMFFHFFIKNSKKIKRTWKSKEKDLLEFKSGKPHKSFKILKLLGKLFFGKTNPLILDDLRISYKKPFFYFFSITLFLSIFIIGSSVVFGKLSIFGSPFFLIILKFSIGNFIGFFLGFFIFSKGDNSNGSDGDWDSDWGSDSSGGGFDGGGGSSGGGGAGD